MLDVQLRSQRVYFDSTEASAVIPLRAEYHGFGAEYKEVTKPMRMGEIMEGVAPEKFKIFRKRRIAV